MGWSIYYCSAMGDEGSEYTQGYLQSQDQPTFKVYDASAGEIYDVDMNQIDIIQQGGDGTLDGKI